MCEVKGSAEATDMMARIVLVAVAFVLTVVASSVSVAAQDGVGEIITESMFNSMLPNRDNASCPAKGFYAYEAFIAAAKAFPAFGTTGSAERMKRELAAFFGQTSQETTGRLVAADGQYQWGYCYKEANETYKYSGSRPYYGRGPLQLEWEWNYKAAGNALGVDLVSNPDLVSTDPVISFKTAIWFWMTPQSPQPSCHDVITGNWKPTAADGGAAQVPGFGVISQLINGGIECGKVPSNVDNINRIGYYKRYCDMLGIGTGDNLDCYTLQRFPELEPPPAPPASQLKTIVLSSVLGSAAVVVIIAAAVYLYFTSKYRRWRKEQDKLSKAMHNLPGMPTQIDYSEIRKATKGFHATMKLGKGGFGAVYRCTLPAAVSRTGQPMEVAVKKFMRDLEDRRYNDFLAEVSIINRLRHKNIVPLVGWSYNKGEPLLVYEYMTNGSLDQHLFRGGTKGNNRQEEAATGHWDTRYGIVRDVATGLHYVHHEHEPMVLHRDIKASNIMLDSTFSARLGDFGIACTVAVDRSSVTGVAGTIGYIAPDYAISHKATRHSDIYAFGVLTLEIVTGKKSSDVPPDDAHITDWVWRLHQEGKLLEAVDSSVIATGAHQQDVADEAKRLLLLGLACTNPNPFNRPSMVEVVQMINKLAPAPEVPLERPTFVWPPEDWRTRNSVYSTAMSNCERSSESTIEVEQSSQEQTPSVTTRGQHSCHS